MTQQIVPVIPPFESILGRTNPQGIVSIDQLWYLYLYNISQEINNFAAGGVASFNTRTGAVTLTSGDVIAALTFTPYNSSNPSGYISANQTISLTGDVTGSGTTGILTALSATGVTIGTYTNATVTVDAKGRITSIANGAAGSGTGGAAIPGMDGIDGEEGMPIPGQQGLQGIAGISGAMGMPGIDGLDGEEGMPVPGQAGSAGAVGQQGAIAAAIMFDGQDGEDGMMRTGPTGNTGLQGQQGVAVFVTDGDTGDDGQPIPGSTYTAGLLGISAGLTANTTINDTVTYTTGGVTLAAQVATAGYMWRVKARGTFVAVSSATARNYQVACFWGATQLTAITAAVLASVAQTTTWELEFLLTGVDTTHIWTAGGINNKISFPAIVAATTSQRTLDLATPGSTAVTAGAQTIDLRFSMSVAVATDQWVVQAVTIERIC